MEIQEAIEFLEEKIKYHKREIEHDFRIGNRLDQKSFIKDYVKLIALLQSLEVENKAYKEMWEGIIRILRTSIENSRD